MKKGNYNRQDVLMMIAIIVFTVITLINLHTFHQWSKDMLDWFTDFAKNFTN